MRCDDIRTNLIALLHHELSLAEEEVLRTHLSACIGCQQELEHTRAIKRVLRGIAPIEPAAQMRRNLERRLRNTGYRDLSDPRGAPPRPLLRGDVPARPAGPPALPYDPPKSLPAPAVTESGLALIPNVGAPSPSSRAVSERLDAGRRRHLRQLKILFGACGFLLALAVLATLAFSINSTPPLPAAAAHVEHSRFWEQRRVAKMRNAIADALVIKDQIRIDNPNNESTRVVRHCAKGGAEKCLVLYTESDIRRLQGDPHIDQARLEALLGDSSEAETRDGKTAIAGDDLKSFLDLDDAHTRVKVIKLDNRTEIWAATTFEKYMDDIAPADSTAKDINGLPQVCDTLSAPSSKPTQE